MGWKNFSLVLIFLVLICVLVPPLDIKLMAIIRSAFGSKFTLHNWASADLTASETVIIFGQNSGINLPFSSTLLFLLTTIGGLFANFARKRFEEFKAGTDFLIASAGLFVTSPIILLAAIAIKLTSPGPVIYKQYRVGKKRKIFKIYKLRTMVVDAERGRGAVWAKENDPRTTPVGKFLRKYHIDEIPQFLNVIKGDMSIVGPRPERPEMVRDLKKLIIDYEKRLMIKPGITGLAQIYHKYDETILDVRKKIKYDMLYMKKRGWLVELGIISKTLIAALSRKGAR